MQRLDIGELCEVLTLSGVFEIECPRLKEREIPFSKSQAGHDILSTHSLIYYTACRSDGKEIKDLDLHRLGFVSCSGSDVLSIPLEIVRDDNGVPVKVRMMAVGAQPWKRFGRSVMNLARLLRRSALYLQEEPCVVGYMSRLKEYEKVLAKYKRSFHRTNPWVVKNVDRNIQECLSVSGSLAKFIQHDLVEIKADEVSQDKRKIYMWEMAINNSFKELQFYWDEGWW